MRTIEYTARFRRDLRRELKGRYRRAILEDLDGIVDLLRVDALLEARLQDHALSGELQDHRDLHIRPDLVLVYCKPYADTLRLVRLGTHSELGF